MKNRIILLVAFVLINFNVSAQNNVLKDVGISINLLLAGFFGALLLVKKEGKTWKDNLLTLVTGSFSAVYLTGFILEIFSIKSKNATSFFGFVVGFASIQIMEFVINKYFKKQKSND